MWCVLSNIKTFTGKKHRNVWTHTFEYWNADNMFGNGNPPVRHITRRQPELLLSQSYKAVSDHQKTE